MGGRQGGTAFGDLFASCWRQTVGCDGGRQACCFTLLATHIFRPPALPHPRRLRQHHGQLHLRLWRPHLPEPGHWWAAVRLGACRVGSCWPQPACGVLAPPLPYCPVQQVTLESTLAAQPHLTALHMLPAGFNLEGRYGE